MKTPWFKRVGWFHLPLSISGSMATLTAVAFLAHPFSAIDHRSHSVGDAAYGIFPFVTGAFLLLDWLGGADIGKTTGPMNPRHR